jgi:hypothetical protein
VFKKTVSSPDLITSEHCNFLDVVLGKKTNFEIKTNIRINNIQPKNEWKQCVSKVNLLEPNNL